MDLSAADSGSSSNSAPPSGPGLDSASEGGEINYEELFRTSERELTATKSRVDRSERELGDLGRRFQETDETLARIKRAVTNEDAPRVDETEARIQSLEAEIDKYLEAGIEAEKRGQKIPLTVNAAIQAFRHQIESLRSGKQTSSEIEQLKKEIKELKDPSRQIDLTAYSNMDSHLMQALQTMYGPESDDVVGTKFESISKMVIREIQDMRRNEPEVWDRVRRDRQAQVNLVNHFVKKSIPPRARQIIEEDEVRRNPLSDGELLHAFREAKELAKKDPRQAKYVEQIRADLLGRMMEKNMGGGSSRTRLSEREY